MHAWATQTTAVIIVANADHPKGLILALGSP